MWILIFNQEFSSPHLPCYIEQLTARKLQIYASSETERITWKTGFWVTRLHQFPILDSEPVVFSKLRVPLEKTITVNIYPLPGFYDLEITIPRWHRDLKIQIWRELAVLQALDGYFALDSGLVLAT